MLEVRNLSSGYGKVQILNDVNLKIEEGEIVSVIGRNGVGKSTFCKTVIGILPTMQGEILFDGTMNISKTSAYRRARAGIAYVPQGHGIFPKLTVHENLTIGALINEAQTTTSLVLGNAATRWQEQCRAENRQCFPSGVLW